MLPFALPIFPLPTVVLFPNVFLPLLHMLGLDDVTTLGDSSGELELNAAASTTVAEA